MAYVISFKTWKHDRELLNDKILYRRFESAPKHKAQDSYRSLRSFFKFKSY